MIFGCDSRCAESSQDPIEDLVCPGCEAPLAKSSERLDCTNCGRSARVVSGVPHFVEEFPYWGEIPLEQMQELNRRAAGSYWKSALLEFDNPAVKQASLMMTNLDRVNWQWLIDLPQGSRVLDIGGGTGTVSHALALHYREVIALEPVLERVEFMRRRFRQEGLSNVKVVRSSVWNLPFGPKSFDLVAMNEVLKWSAEGSAEGPKELQARALRKAFSLLRPGGYLYLGIENRTILSSLVGYPDARGLPGVPVFPCPLEHGYARWHGSAPWRRSYLHSSRGYRRLLKAAGFKEVEIYHALPSCNHPRFYLPLDRQIFSYYAQAFDCGKRKGLRGFLRWALLKSGVLQYLQHSFAIFARKDEPQVALSHQDEVTKDVENMGALKAATFSS
jgi:SAM-dependent methyltransferase